MQGHEDVIKCLLEHCGGRSSELCHLINAQCVSCARTALWIACDKNLVEGTRMLLEAGSDPSLADMEGITPLEIARQRGLYGCVHLLKVS